jgi:hypothetical protein
MWRHNLLLSGRSGPQRGGDRGDSTVLARGFGMMPFRERGTSAPYTEMDRLAAAAGRLAAVSTLRRFQAGYSLMMCGAPRKKDEPE